MRRRTVVHWWRSWGVPWRACRRAVDAAIQDGFLAMRPEFA